MTGPTMAIVGGLAVLTVWGAIAPRGQWRLLAAWSRREPYASEPGPVSVGIHRVVAIIATVALVVGVWGLWEQYRASLPQPARALSSVELTWGAPDPLVLNRVVDAVSQPPVGLVEQPVLHYEILDAVHRSPSYLFDLRSWSVSKLQVEGGLVGSTPPAGHVALDSATLVVQVSGDRRCIPRAVVLDEGSSTVTVGVYYGLPGRDTATTSDCNPGAPAKSTVSLLVPLGLAEPLGTRTLQNVDGSVVTAVSDHTD